MFDLTLMLFFILILFWSSPTLAGVPQLIHPEKAEAIGWENPAAIPYWIDQGGLGKLGHTQARELVEAMMGVWEEVSTSSVQFHYVGELTDDVTAATINDYVNLSICSDNQPPSNPSMIRGESPIIFDSTGEIMEMLAGKGASKKIVGKSALRCFKGTTADPEYATQAFIVLNGKFIDGENDVIDLPINVLAGVVLHELGHFLGLHHSMVNESLYYEISQGKRDVDDSRFLPVMFPLVLKDSAASTVLKPDDVAAISALYPVSFIKPEFGEIHGSIVDAAGFGVRGANVVARAVDDPWCQAVSTISGRYCTPLTDSYGNLDLTSEACVNPEKEGDYKIVGLPAGSYTVEVGEIAAGGDARSNMFPRTDGINLPGNAEFFNFGDQGAENPLAGSEVTIVEGEMAERIDIVLDAAQPTTFQTDAINLAVFSPSPEGISACTTDPVDYQELMNLVGNVANADDSDSALGGSSPSPGCSLRPRSPIRKRAVPLGDAHRIRPVKAH